MSLADITSDLSSDPEDHVAIIRHVAFHPTEHGGWDEWSVACICGGFYQGGTPGGKWFIPSVGSAERLYTEHLRVAGVIPSDEIPSDDNEADDQPDYEEIIKTFAAPHLMDVVRACVGAGMTKRQVISMLHQFINTLESENE